MTSHQKKTYFTFSLKQNAQARKVHVISVFEELVLILNWCNTNLSELDKETKVT